MTTSRQESILQAALQCFTELGLEGTTIRHIQERSGASVGSIYHHFGSKESIAASLLILGLQKYHAELQDRLNPEAGAEECIKTVVLSYAQWVSTNPDWARFMIFYRSKITEPQKLTQISEHNRKHIGFLFRLLQSFIQTGHIRALPAEIYPSLIMGSATDYAKKWLSGKASVDILKYSDAFAEAAWLSLKR